jgi:hypothetical protein
MRVAASSFLKPGFAPYSVEGCAYFVKQDPLCEGDYFYSLDHLNMTDFKEGNWETYKRVQMKTDPEKRDLNYDWKGDKKTFLNEYEIDFNHKENELRSFFLIHKQLRYGCWCRAKQDENNPNVASYFMEWKEQTETAYGVEGDTYKFDVPGEENKDTYGPRMLMDPLPQHQCAYPNYKIQGLTGYWGCTAMEPKPIWGWVLSDGKKSLASPKYYMMMQHLGDGLNLANGVYSFMCYAGDKDGGFAYKMWGAHEMRSWSQGPEGIGWGEYKHTVKDGVTLCSTLGGSKKFTYNYTIEGKHDPPENRTMHFVIENWKFEDGRMEYVNDETVEDDYVPHEDARWSRFKDKWTVYYEWTQTTTIQMDVMNLAAARTWSMNCDDMAGIGVFQQKIHRWLKENEVLGANYTQYIDDTKDGIYYDDGTTNSKMIMDWYFDTMAAASDASMDIRKKGIQCKRLAFCTPPHGDPLNCPKGEEWEVDYVWPAAADKPQKTGNPLVDFFLSMGRDTEAEPEKTAAREVEAKRKPKYARA